MILVEERLQLGDEQRRLLEQLHEQTSNRMLRIAMRALPDANIVDAEDVVQTVFAEAAAAMADRPYLRTGEGWLIQRLRSRIGDHYRRQRRQQCLLAALVEDEPHQSAEDVVADRFAVTELVETIPDRLDRMTLAARMQGYREADIARLLGLSLEGRQVRDRLRRIRKQLSATIRLATGEPRSASARPPEQSAPGRTSARRGGARSRRSEPRERRTDDSCRCETPT